MLPDRIATPARALALVLVTGVSIAGLAPLIGQPVKEHAALWVATEHALVRVGMEGEGAHRTTDPLPGAAVAEVRVRGNRLVTAREGALATHALTPTLELTDGATRALDEAEVTDLAAAPDAGRIWLARAAATGRDSTITAFARDLTPQWQRTLSGEVIALAATPTGDHAAAVWALQARDLVGLDHTGATVARVDLPLRPRVRDFVPLADGRFAVANARGIRIVGADGAVLHRHDQANPRRLHALGADRSGTTGLWSVGRHRITLFDAELAVVRSWHLSSHGIGHKVTAARSDPRDDSLWFAAGDALYHAHADGRLQRHRDLSDYLGREAITELALYVDTFAPELTLIEPEGTRITKNDQPELILDHDDTGLGVDPETLEPEHADAPINSNCTTDAEAGRSTCTFGPLADGRYSIRASVADHAGNESDAVEAVLEIDTIPPEIMLDAPANGAHVNTDAVTFRGRLSEAAEFAINGEPVGLDIDYHFERSLPLAADGAHAFELTAEDAAGNTGARTIVVIRDTVVPAAIAAGDITIEDGATDDTVRIEGANGTAEPGADVLITNTRTGETTVVSANGDGAFVAEMAGEVGDSFEITVRDRAGNESETVEVDSGSEVPPDPEDVAPPLPETGIPPFEEQTAFLYEGSNPIQQDVAPGTIEAERVSVLRGAVRNRAGDPIPGVTVSILNHPELGYTATQADGDFDMAVNGGGHLTVEYHKNGYLPVQRTVRTEWNGWYHADDVVMIELDDKVTTIDLSDDSQPFQVAHGSEVTDSDGTRRATVLFPAGTTAEITLADGTKKQLTELDVRATEYTVGESGPAAMPGELPPTTAYTYAVELSVDQALEQGVKVEGKDVVFNQPVPVYVDNFLDFPVGEPVPVGYYNNDDAAWVPHDNGRIIGVLDEQNGHAVLDVTGDGEPATREELDELGITAAERTRIAELHEAGDSLWRFATTHLSTWDCNWPYRPPDDGNRPTTRLPEPDQNDEPDNSDEEDCEEGCVISPQKQSLGESIDIPGTPYSLHYQSDRASGAADNTVTIPVTGDEIPDSLRSVELEIEIAGQRVTETFGPEPNQDFTFTWDGQDRFGRAVAGSAEATIRLSWVYPCQYVGGASGGSSFGRVRYQASPIGTRSRCLGFRFPRTTTVTLQAGNSDATAHVGNWSLSAVHALSRETATLLRGDGIEREPVAAIDTYVAPYKDSMFNDIEYESDPVHRIDLRNARNIATAPDGSLYIADSRPRTNRIWRVSPSGEATLIAGYGDGFSNDGYDATGALLAGASDVAVGPQGNIYIADSGNHRIRRVTPEGIIDTVAGSGPGWWGDGEASGDGGPATQARLDNPAAVEVAPDGSLYILDTGSDDIRKVDPNGIIRTIVDGDIYHDIALGPNGELHFTQRYPRRLYRRTTTGEIETVAGTHYMDVVEGSDLATENQLQSAGEISIGPRGQIYLAASLRGYDAWIWKIAQDGTISAVAGNGSKGFSGDNGPATDAALSSVSGLALDGSGILYIADSGSGNNNVRRVIPGIRTSSGEGAFVASESGSQAFFFDEYGRHDRTVDAHTGETRYEVERDEDGQVVRLVDSDGNTTRIERDATGHGISIVSPDNQRTAVRVNDDGQLEEVTHPSGSTWAMDYTAGGLLTRISKPGGAVNTFSYNEAGRLIEDLDPNGGGWQLARTRLEDGYRTEMTSGEGRVRRFTTERPADRKRVYSKEAADGTVTRRVYTDTGTTTERPDGTTLTTSVDTDPRFGMAAPYVAERHIELPTGLTLDQTTDRTVELTDKADPLSLDTLVETVTTNGRTHTAAYDGAAREWSITSPEGRRTTTVIDGQSRPLTQSIPGVASITTTYDDRGRPVSVEQGDNANARTTTFGYHEDGDQAGYLASVTDALGRTVAFERDASGRVTEQALPDGRTIDYQYDTRGNVTAFTPPGRDAHVFEYDGLDQRTSYIPPDVDGVETVTRHVYNLDRQIRRIERPGDETVTFDYDSGGRLAARRMPAGDTTYGYDGTTGQVNSIAAPSGVGLQFQWDGFLPVRTGWTGPVPGSVSRDFDNNFWLTREIVNGHAVSFDYDNDGLLTNAGELTLARDAGNGLVTGTTQATVTGSRGYNGFGELAERSVTAGGGAIYGVDYTRDKLGRLVEETETIDGETRTWSYDYDLAGRLTEVREDGTPVHLYSYDANGNRTSHTGPAGTRNSSYDTQDRISEYGDATYTHTPAGERATKATSRGTTEYDYDAAGNLRQVVLPDGTTIEYLIDGQDRRIGKMVDGTLQTGWLFRDQLNPVAQLDETGAVTHRFVYGDKSNVPVYMIKDGTTYRIVSDHLGSVRLVIDTGTGEIVQRMDYSPFGRVTTDTRPGFQPFGFAGGLYDADTGLVRFGARDYDPEIGRWTAKDPIGFAGGDTNLFGYVLNDPRNLVDPRGEIAPAVYIAVQAAIHGGRMAAPHVARAAIAASRSIARAANAARVRVTDAYVQATAAAAANPAVYQNAIDFTATVTTSGAPAPSPGGYAGGVVGIISNIATELSPIQDRHSRSEIEPDPC